MKNIISIFISFTLLMACQPRKNGVSNHETNYPSEYIKGELIVSFKNESTYKTAIKDLEKNKNIQFIDMLMTSPPDALIGHFRVPKGKEKEMITLFQKHPDVKSVELNALGTFGNLTNSERPEEKADNFIKGKVESIENGKDGYTAKIKTAEDKVYFATISIPNLGRENAHQYRRVSIGEIIELKGDMWTMGDEQRITVREIKPKEK